MPTMSVPSVVEGQCPRQEPNWVDIGSFVVSIIALIVAVASFVRAGRGEKGEKGDKGDTGARGWDGLVLDIVAWSMSLCGNLSGSSSNAV